MSHRSPLSNAEKFQFLAILLSGSWNDKNIFMMNAMASDLNTRLKNKTFRFFSFARKMWSFFQKRFPMRSFFKLKQRAINILCSYEYIFHKKKDHLIMSENMSKCIDL